MAESPLTPEDGDIVIRHQRLESKWAFFLQATPGPEQFTLPTVNEAITLANTFAKDHRVRVWITEDDRSFRIVTDFRPQRQPL